MGQTEARLRAIGTALAFRDWTTASEVFDIARDVGRMEEIMLDLVGAEMEQAQAPRTNVVPLRRVASNA